jgi:hypothetical protein
MPREIPPFLLDAKPLTPEGERVAGYKWAEDHIGKRHRIGGVPDLIQPEQQWPVCTSCREKMSFYAQLDGIGSEYAIADCGMIYVFLCFGCFESASFVDSF